MTRIRARMFSDIVFIASALVRTRNLCLQNEKASLRWEAPGSPVSGLLRFKLGPPNAENPAKNDEDYNDEKDAKPEIHGNPCYKPSKAID
jgi:hypothetical protein